MKIYKIKEICHLEKGKQIDTTLLSDANPYKYINGGIKESGYYTTYNTEGETVLVSEGGASCGYVNYINEKFWCGCHCYKLTQCKFLPKYIYYALKGNQENLMTLRTGAAMPNIKKTTFQDLELLLNENPAEQEMVISELNNIQIAIDIKKTELSSLDDLVKSRFIEMFGDPRTNSKNLPELTLPELGEFGRGVSKHRPRNAPELLGGKYPLIQTGEVANAELYINEYTNTYSELGYKQSKMWKAGTLCITIAANIAKTGILSFDACFPDSVVGFLANEKTNNIFIHFWFSFFQEILEAQAPASAQKNINLRILSELKVIVPPIELQNEFSEFVKLTDKSKFIVQKQIEDLQELLDSKMDEYFG